MRKGERHRRNLVPLFDGFVETSDPEGLREYLASNSGLPGPRANLELAGAFADIVAENALTIPHRMWHLCTAMAGIHAGDAPTNEPREFLPFCGTVGIGAIGAASAPLVAPALALLRSRATDPRWRMREAVCFGLQRLLATRRPETINTLAEWVADGNALEMRAVAAALAEPDLLRDGDFAVSALNLHRAIIGQALKLSDRRSEGFRKLRQALGYTLSVITAAIPEAGFAFLQDLAQSEDADLRWILRRNLRKNLLIKTSPEDVARIEKLFG